MCDTEPKQDELLTCESCRFYSVDGFLCLVNPPHYACGSGGERKVDGVPTMRNRQACSAHPGNRKNSVSDQFIEMMRSLLAMQAFGLQEAHDLTQIVQDKMDPYK